MNKKGFIMPLAIMSLAAVLVAVFVWYSLDTQKNSVKNDSLQNEEGQPKTTKCCGNGWCAIFCTGDINSCPCETPRSCPQDCRLACNWVYEKYALDETQSENLDHNLVCELVILNSENKSVGEYRINAVFSEYSCENNSDCMQDHFCTKVIFSTNPAAEIKQGSICIINPKE